MHTNDQSIFVFMHFPTTLDCHKVSAFRLLLSYVPLFFYAPSHWSSSSLRCSGRDPLNHAQGMFIVFLCKALCSHCGLPSLITSCYRNLDKFWHLVSHLTQKQNLVIPHSPLSTKGTLTRQRRNFPELTCFWHLPD